MRRAILAALIAAGAGCAGVLGVDHDPPTIAVGVCAAFETGCKAEIARNKGLVESVWGASQCQLDPSVVAVLDVTSSTGPLAKATEHGCFDDPLPACDALLGCLFQAGFMPNTGASSAAKHGEPCAGVCRPGTTCLPWDCDVGHTCKDGACD